MFPFSVGEVHFELYAPMTEDIVGTPMAPFTLTLPTSSSLKVDESVSEKVPGKRRTRDWKNFEHFKSVCNPPDIGYSIPTYVNDGSFVYRGVMKDTYSAYSREYNQGVIDGEPYGDAGRLDKGLPPFVQEDDDGTSVVSPSEIDKMNSHALGRMLPYIKEQLSLVNSLIELKDFKTLPKTFRELVRFTRNFAREFEYRKGMTLREMLRLAGDAFLQWKFNISPLISDIMGIYRSLVGLEARINDLVSRAGRPQTRHYAFRWTEFPNVSETSPLYTPVGVYDDVVRVGPVNGMKQIRTVSYAPSTFHAEIQYNYNYTKYQIDHARLLSTLDSLGIKVNPGIVWNAIPWSFVVDWVLRVGDYLDSFEVRNMEPQINILKYLWSVKRSRRILVSRGISDVTAGDWVTPDLGKQYYYPAVQQTCYKRVCELPSKSSIESSGLNSTEFTLAAALVVSRKRRYHKRLK